MVGGRSRDAVVAPESKGPGHARRAFVRGLRCRKVLVIIAGAALGALMLGAVHVLFTTGLWSAVSLRVWLRADRATASGTYASWTIARFRRNPPPLPMLYLLGGSTAREATVDNGDSLAASIREDGGPEVGAQNLGTPVQTFAHGLTMVDSLPDSTPTTILIGVSPGRFGSGAVARSRDSSTLGMLVWGPALQDFLDRESIDQKPLPPLVDIAQTLADTVRSDARRLLRGRLPQTEYIQHKWDKAAIKPDDVMTRRAQEWTDGLAPRFSENVHLNLTVLEELVRHSQARGFDVVIVELPRNLDLVRDRWDAFDDGYQPQTRRIADAYGIAYLDFNRELGIPSEAFFDTHHVLAPGRVVWEARLAQKLAKMYRSGALRSSRGSSQDR